MNLHTFIEAHVTKFINCIILSSETMIQLYLIIISNDRCVYCSKLMSYHDFSDFLFNRFFLKTQSLILLIFMVFVYLKPIVQLKLNLRNAAL